MSCNNNRIGDHMAEIVEVDGKKIERRKILHIDMLNLFIRNFAVQHATNEQGVDVGGIFGCLQSFNKFLRIHKPDVVHVAWEGKGSSKRRREMLEQYKSSRKFSGFNKKKYKDDEKGEKESLIRQLNRLRDYIAILPFYQTSVDFLEADDTIAYCVEHIFDGPEWENVIITTDRDYFQLVSETTTIHRPVKTKKYKDGEIVTPEFVMDFYGIHPDNLPILKAIMGDASDEIDGIKGVGAKTAIKDFEMLESLKDGADIYTIDDILEIAQHRFEVEKKKKYAKYLDHRDLLKRNYELMQLLIPNMSLQARSVIHKTFKDIPKFKPTQFRLMIIGDSISPPKMFTWAEMYMDMKPKPIILEEKI
jgi:5'-3' exonuclease